MVRGGEWAGVAYIFSVAGHDVGDAEVGEDDGTDP